MQRKIPVSDNHIHVWREIPLKDTLDFHKSIFDQFGYETTTILALTEEGKKIETTAQMAVLKALYLKKVLSPKVYAYAALHLERGDRKSTAENLLSDVKMYKRAGFDGMKMLYNLSMYEYPYPNLSHKIYEPYFKYMEETGFPILLHIGGPEMCWGDPEKIPPEQRKWHIDNTYIHLYDMFDDFLRVMDKFPKLKIVLAHFGFVTEHIDWAEEWLKKYENLYFDLTPSLFMYYDFQKNKKAWTEFFIKYQDRIIYGTDIGSNTLDVEQKEPRALVHLVQGFFSNPDIIYEFEEEFSPMVLPDSVLKKIFRENMLRLHNNMPPAEICEKEIYPEIEFEEKYGAKTPLAIENLDIIKKEFGF